ncbi:MAG TPA: glycosyltransferase family 1 protein [Homoserinimonas sp.]|nr:glycosyltransferase family 1 protein [Homoserinimonas sp.]
MKIVFDCRYTRIGRHDGISRYTAGLVAALAELHPVTMLINDERQLELLPDLPWILGCDPTSLREPWVSRAVNRAGADVVFSPMQMMGSAGRRYRLILTLHDLIYYTNRTPPRYFSWPVRLGWRVYHLSWLPVKLLLRRADAVVTGSHTTRQELIDAGVYRRKITVVRSAVERVETTPRPAPAGRSLVYMGSFMPYKNVETVVAAMHRLPGYTLHLLSGISPADRGRLSALAPSGSIEFHDGVSEEEYFELLSGATALVTASRQEGFGIPLVEAMRVGTPVVVSDIPVFHEIGGDAAAYFSPDDPDELAAAVGELERPGEWEARSAASVAQSRQFTWEASARVLFDLIIQTVSSRAAPSGSVPESRPTLR